MILNVWYAGYSVYSVISKLGEAFHVILMQLA